MKNIAIAMMTFARPDYLDKALTSLEECFGTQEYDYFFFQDGLKGSPHNPKYRNITQEMVDQCIERVKASSLPIVEHKINEVNRGVSWQINSVFDLFDRYDALFIFEDDLIVSKWYLRLLKQVTTEMPNCVVSFHSVGKKYAGNNHDLRLLVKANCPRTWGFNMTKEVWNKFQPIWRQRWLKEFRHGVRTPYYDTVMTQALKKIKVSKRVPLISRAYGIGEEGILSTNPTNWKRRGLHRQQKQYQFKEDKKICGFKLRR